LSSPSWHCSGIETRALSSTLGVAMTLRRRFLALCLGFAMTLRSGFRALHFYFAMTQSRDFQASRLEIASMIFISLASEVWTLLSDDLSSVILRQST